MSKRILVTGITGNVGSEVAKFLQEAGLSFKAGVRNIEKAKKLVGEDIEFVAFDFMNPETYQGTFEGVDKMFLVRPPAITDTKKHINPLIDYAKKIGVAHIVFLSLMGVEHNPIVPHYNIEKYLKASGIPYTFLRTGFFMQNLNSFDFHREDIQKNNIIFLPAGKGKTSFIDIRDIAKVAVKAFQDESLKNAAPTLTGGEALTYFEVADIFSDVLGKTITYTNPSRSEFKKIMLRRGLDAGFVNVMCNLYFLTKIGMAKKITPDVERILGKPPITIRQYVQDYAECWK